ncbi:MAG: CHAT domain-containing tetratricopeptide repeat protein [Bacteroidota bacterium]
MNKILYICVCFIISSGFSQNPELKKKYNITSDFYNNAEFEKAYILYSEIKKRSVNDNIDTIYKYAALGQAKSLIQTGNKFSFQGDYYLADIYYKNALFLFENEISGEYAQYGHLNRFIGYNYFVLKKWNEAIKYYSNALKLYPRNYGNERAIVYTDLALTYYRLNNKQESFDNFEKALSFFYVDSIYYAHDIASVYENYGFICLNENISQKSEEMFLKSYRIFNDLYGDSSEYTWGALNYLGHFYKITGNYRKSIEYFQKCINSIMSDSCFSKITLNKQKTTLVNEKLLYAMRYKAHALYQLYMKESGDTDDLLASYYAFEECFELIDFYRSDKKNEESNLIFSESYKETVDNAITTCLSLYNNTKEDKYLNKMFEYIENGKASLLYKALIENQSMLRSGIPEFLIQYEVSLNTRIGEIKKALALQSSEDNDFYCRLFELISKQNKYNKYIEARYPDSKSLKFEYQPISIKDIQQKLRKNEVVLEYKVVDSLLICMLIDANNTEFYSQTIDSSFYRDLDNLYLQISSADLSESYQANISRFSECSYTLYSILIKPFEQKIENMKLIIIPNEVLMNIPFDVLIKENMTDRSDFSNLKYLLFEHAISYSYSASLLVNSKKAKKTAVKNLLAIAPDYSFSDQNSLSELSNSADLQNLPFTITEARNVAVMFNGVFISGKHASKQYFMKNVGFFKILHIAAHSLVDYDNSMLSGLFFSKIDTIRDDSFLSNIELYNLPVNAELVVLSGCYTGRGKLYKGEGVYNLARSFILKGCPSIIISLWDLHDESGADITFNMYKYIYEGESLDYALQKSKIDFIKSTVRQKAHPFFWAGNVIIGDVKPVCQSSTNWTYLIIGLVIVLLIRIIICQLHIYFSPKNRT